MGLISSIIPILIGLLVFGVLVIVHEWGHFIVARKAGIFVEEFAIGMGPKVFETKPGETIYSVRIFPIGGFCKMLGEDGVEEDSSLMNERSFNSKSLPKRMAVILAGAAMNVLLAMVLFVFINLLQGTPVNIIETVNPNSPAEIAGLLPKDKIIGINNIMTEDNLKISETVSTSNGSEVVIKIERDDTIFDIPLKPLYSEESQRFLMGISFYSKTGFLMPRVEGIPRATFGEGIKEGFTDIYYLMKAMIQGIANIFSLNVSKDDIAGPIGVVDLIGTKYNESVERNTPGIKIFIMILSFTSALSLSIGIFNLLPIPALDGGRFFILLIEAVFRKPMTPEVEGKIHFVGFVLIMGLAVFVAYNDIVKIMAR